MNKYVFFLLITMCAAKIQIKIRTGNLANTTIITHQDSDIRVVDEKDIKLFNITDENLKRGSRVELGSYPDWIFLKDPTKYGNTFHRFNWTDVTRKSVISNIRIFEFIKEDVLLKRIDHINYSEEAINTKTDLAVIVTNTLTTIWKNSDDALDLNIIVEFEHNKTQKQETIVKNSSMQTYNVAMNKTKGVIEIQPGQSVAIKLLAEKVILLIEVEISSQLFGNVVANYAREYGSHYFWAPCIENVMKAAKLKNNARKKMLIEVRYYTNARIDITDNVTGEKLCKDVKIIRKPKQRNDNKWIFKPNNVTTQSQSEKNDTISEKKTVTTTVKPKKSKKRP